MTKHIHTLSKKERLSSKTDIKSLIFKGQFGICGCLNYTFRKNDKGLNRIVVTAPKKNFKRAVKRNLLKRRIREAYRLQKENFNLRGYDLMFYYNSKKILDYDVIYKAVENTFTAIEKKVAKRKENKQSKLSSENKQSTSTSRKD